MTTGYIGYRRPQSLGPSLTPEEVKHYRHLGNLERVLKKWQNHARPGLITDKGTIKDLRGYELNSFTYTRLNEAHADLSKHPEAIRELEEAAEATAKIARMHLAPAEKQIRNGRLELKPEEQQSIHTTGFLLRSHKSAVTDWDSEAQLSSIYHKEMAQLVKHETGASHVFCGDHAIRRPKGEMDTPLKKIFAAAVGAATFVHNDFTEIFGESVIQQHITGKTHTHVFGMMDEFKEANVTEELLRNSRIMVINTWRSISPYPMGRLPLAVCDKRSVSLKECQIFRTAPASKGGLEIFYAEESPDHAWYYFPKQTREECLLITTYDSEAAPFIPTLHTSFDDPDYLGPNVPERWSIEMRCLCLIPMPPGQTSRLATPGPTESVGPHVIHGYKVGNKTRAKL